MVRNVLDQLNTKIDDFNSRDGRSKNKGRPRIISPGSSDEGIIADWMEDNMGFRNTTVMVNQHRRDEGRGPVGKNAVMNAFDRMDPIPTHTEKMCQGDNKNKNWRLARKNQSKQNLIMRGLITKDQLLTEYDGDTPLV